MADQYARQPFDSRSASVDTTNWVSAVVMCFVVIVKVGGLPPQVDLRYTDTVPVGLQVDSFSEISDRGLLHISSNGGSQYIRQTCHETNT